MRRAWLALALFAALVPGCGPPTVSHFPRFSETQNEWLQAHCHVTWIGEVDDATPLEDERRKLHADVVERLASASSVVQLVAYKCSEPVPEVVARGEQP